MRQLFELRDQAADAIDEAEDFVRENAVPVGLAAVAFGIAVTVARRSDDIRQDRYDDAGGDEYTRYALGDDYATDAARARTRPLIDRAKRGLSEFRGNVGDTADRAKSAVTAAREVGAQRIQRASTGLSSHAAEVGDRLAAGLDQIRGRVTDTVRVTSDAARGGVRATGDVIAANPEAVVLLALVGGGLLALSRTFDVAPTLEHD